ncbi:heparan sulfate glucosamine 3-O-sulfotransferase 1-like [Watersipora subatra]|uniref:heparan sulfate glucosamine 3-O-sulfotransferase 1-like n=1 Tax=Watersipora subatra TaxID=2589382 RepID=UPI00355AE75D
MRAMISPKSLLFVCIGLFITALLFHSARGPWDVHESAVDYKSPTTSNEALKEPIEFNDAHGPPSIHDSAHKELTADLEDDSVARKRVPDAIVVGAGKCGTDALITYLNTSRSFVINTLFESGMKELNYFNTNYEMGTQWYIDQMPAVKDKQVLIEKCAPYFWDPAVPSRVHSLKPDMKLIMVLCDPVKRLVSLYTHINSYKLGDGSDPLPPFTDLLQVKDGQITESYHPRPVMPFLKTGLYSDFIEQWLKYFPLNQMVFVSGEELVRDPLPELAKVTKFLGKPNAVTSDNMYYDKERGFFCFKGYDQSKSCMSRSTKGRKHPVLDSELLKTLQDHFRPYNEKLELMIGQRFGWPTYFGQSS